MRDKIMELLPKTDCRKCGHDTCLVFATELAQRQASVEACPDITSEVRIMLAEITAAEEEMVRAFRDMKISDVSGAFRMLYETVILPPVRVIAALLFTFPLSLPVWLVVIWLFMI